MKKIVALGVLTLLSTGIFAANSTLDNLYCSRPMDWTMASKFHYNAHVQCLKKTPTVTCKLIEVSGGNPQSKTYTDEVFGTFTQNHQIIGSYSCYNSRGGETRNQNCAFNNPTVTCAYLYLKYVMK